MVKRKPSTKKNTGLKPSTKRFWGQILWFDERDGYGIIRDWDGNQLYFDTSSVVIPETITRIKAGRFVSFCVNEAIETPLCACYIRAPVYPVEVAP
jgi:cold shock CspA family protein